MRLGLLDWKQAAGRREPGGGRPGVPRLAALCAVAGLCAAAGCRNEMYDQPRYEAYEASEFFANGASSRVFVAGTVPRGAPVEKSDELVQTGKIGDKLAEQVPIKIDRELLVRGQERYRIYCTPCHGELGDAKGMVVQRGFKPPPSYHSAEILKKPPGHYYDVITRGFGTMYSYAARIQVRDRWAVVAYIQALQLSQRVPVDQLSAADRAQLEGGRP